MLTSSDGNLTLTIPAGALSDSTQISIGGATDAPKNDQRIGAAYAIEPAGTQFAVAATLTMSNKLRAGNLAIATVVNGQWSPLASQVDSMKVTANIDHLSFYELVALPIGDGGTGSGGSAGGAGGAAGGGGGTGGSTGGAGPGGSGGGAGTAGTGGSLDASVDGPIDATADGIDVTGVGGSGGISGSSGATGGLGGAAGTIGAGQGGIGGVGGGAGSLAGPTDASLG